MRLFSRLRAYFFALLFLFQASGTMPGLTVASGSRVFAFQAAAAAKPSENRLKSLSVIGYQFTPSFGAEVQDYSINVPKSTSLVGMVKAVPVDPEARVRVYERQDPSGGFREIHVVVTAQDGSVRSCILTMHHLSQKSSNNYLTSFSTSLEYTRLNPAFSPDVTDYSLTVANSVSMIDIECSTSDTMATVTPYGTDAALKAGAVNVMGVRVTAENGEVRKYKLKVRREADGGSAPHYPDPRLSSLTAAGFALYPAFSPDLFEYTVSVPNGTGKLSLSYAALDPKSTVRVSGNSLVAGSSTDVSVKVTSAGGASKVYVIRAYRAPGKPSESGLSSLSAAGFALTPAFSPDRLQYRVSVPVETDRLELSYSAADPKAKVSVTGNKLAPDAVTSVSLKVTAQDGSSRVYVISATRGTVRSSENRLSSLCLEDYALTPSFSPDGFEYSVTVPDGVARLEISCETMDYRAGTRVSGNVLEDGSPAAVTVNVTAENGQARVYTVMVSRPAVPLQDNCTLASLIPSAGTLSPAFAGNVLAYRLSTGSGDGHLAFSAAAENPEAGIIVSGPSLLEESGGSLLYVITVASPSGRVKAYSVSVSLSGGSQALRPSTSGADIAGGAMIVSAARLNSLFRSPGSFLTVSNAIGQVRVKGGGISCISMPYYDLSLSYSSRHDLLGVVPDGALVVSSAFEGELFGEAEFRLITDMAVPLNVYAWDLESGGLVTVALGVEPENGFVSFSTDRSGTFIVTDAAMASSVTKAQTQKEHR